MVERLARHHLEQVTADEPLPGLRHDPRVGPADRPRRNGPAAARTRRLRGGRSRARQPVGAATARAAGLELVGVTERRLAFPVHQVQLVGQVQDQIALAARPLMAQRDRFELKREIVAEGAVEAEVRVIGPQRRDNLAQGGEDRRTAGAFLLRYHAMRLRDHDRDFRAPVARARCPHGAAAAVRRCRRRRPGGTRLR